MKDETLQREDKKYSGLWQYDYNEANWKRLAKKVAKVAREFENPSLIDFGFGLGNAMDFFENEGLRVAGTEISSYAVERQKEMGRDVYHGSLDELPMFQDDMFTIGFCNDVIEHVPEEYVRGSLEEMSRICSQYLFISVCPTPSHHKSLEGEGLHLTVRPESWWEQQFENLGKTERIKFWFSRSARYMIELD